MFEEMTVKAKADLRERQRIMLLKQQEEQEKQQKLVRKTLLTKLSEFHTLDHSVSNWLNDFVLSNQLHI